MDEALHEKKHGLPVFVALLIEELINRGATPYEASRHSGCSLEVTVAYIEASRTPLRVETDRQLAEALAVWPYVYRWNRCGRKGPRCRVTARGKMNSCRVEFEDGFVMITSRNAIRKSSSPRSIKP